MEAPYEIYNNSIGVKARFIYQGNKVVTAHEQSLSLLSYRGFNHKIKNEAIKKLRPHGPGSPMLLCFNSLPDSWKKLLIKTFGSPDTVARKSLFEQHFKQDMEALHFYQGYKKDNGNALDNELVNEYTLNASVLNTIGWLKRYMNDQRRNIKLSVGNIVTANGVLQPSVWQIVVQEANRFRKIKPHTLPEHEDNIRKLLNKYKENGYPALISGKVGNKNAKIVTPEVEQFLNNLFSGQKHKPNYNEVAQQYDAFLNGHLEIINDNTGEIYNPKEFPKISRSSILSYLSKYENKSGNEISRANNRQRLIAKFIPYHSFEKPKAGSIISIDDRQPPFFYDNGKRMWWYMGIDVGSEAWTCWVYGESKEGIIIEFYRQMVRNYAEWNIPLPAEVEGEISLNSAYTETFLKAGEMFEYTHLEANNARGKIIERYFGKLRYEKERQRIGWIARPYARSEANQGDSQKQVILPKEEIIQNCLRDIEDWNNEPHSRIEGKTRWEVFCDLQNKNVKPTNYRSILLHLGYTTKSSCKAGIIQLNNAEFLLGENGKVALGDHLVQLMCKAEDETLTIHWLDNNEGRVLKAHIYINNSYICEAVAKPTYQKSQIERTADDERKEAIMSSYVATVTAFIKERKNKIDKVTIIDNTPKATPSKAFRIATLNRYEVHEERPTEIMPDVPDELDLMPVEKPTKTSLKERF